MSKLSRRAFLVAGVWLWSCVAIAATPRIAVVDFDSHQYAGELPGAQLADYVVDELVNHNLFDVIEREKLNSIMQELNFGASGFVNAGSAAKIGNMLGATHLMTGRVISVEREVQSMQGNPYASNMRNTTWSISISVRIFETQSGKIVYSDRTRARWVARETSTTRSSTTTPYDRIAEQAAVEVVAGVRRAPFAAGAGASVAAQSIRVPIHSEPPGADIEVDGVFIGNTDGEFDLEPGVRVIRISRAGASPWEKKVRVQKNLQIKAVLQ